jgi:RNA polymerase sigma-70 factor (ECF subfamily)
MLDAPGCCCTDWIAGLARDHAGRLAAVARREGAGPTDPLDLVQDAFHTLLRRPDAEALRGKPDDAARLLAAIVRNAARNLRRRHHRARPHVPIDDAIDEGGDAALAAREPAPDAAIDHARELAQLGTCMAELGEVHRHVVTLRVLEELSGDEAARALGLSPGHVAVLLHRARKQLERCMGAQVA